MDKDLRNKTSLREFKNAVQAINVPSLATTCPHARAKNMFCWPIKIQSFDSQTSKFTRPLGNVLAPLTQMIVADLSNVKWVNFLKTIYLFLYDVGTIYFYILPN